MEDLDTTSWDSLINSVMEQPFLIEKAKAVDEKLHSSSVRRSGWLRLLGNSRYYARLMCPSDNKQTTYYNWGRLMERINPLLTTPPPFKPSTKQETYMKQAPMKKVTYIYGTDILTLNSDALLDAIKKGISDKESLESVGVDSKFIKQQIEELDSMIALLVSTLDKK